MHLSQHWEAQLLWPSGWPLLWELLFWWLFGDSWQRRLAKKIKGVFDEEDVLPTIEGEVKSFWDDTLKAFRSAAKNLDEQCINQLKELEVAFAGSQEDIQKLRERLQRYEEIKIFFRYSLAIKGGSMTDWVRAYYSRV